MDKIYIQPQLYAIVSYLKSAIKDTKMVGVFTSKNSYYNAKAFGVMLNKNSNIKDEKAFGIVKTKNSYCSVPKIFGVMTIPKTPQTHTQLGAFVDVISRNNVVNRGININFDVHEIEKEVNIVPYLTYHFNNQEQIYQYPYITYNQINGLGVNQYPYITYHDSEFGLGGKTKRQWYLNFHIDKWDKTVKCKMYDNTEGFPLKNVHLSCYCSDGKTRYVPMDRLDRDFDSGLRAKDNFGNDFQICVARQENIINKYFPFGDILIPLTTYNDLYAIMCGIFGKAHVTMADDGSGLYFSPPNPTAGITQMFVIGLNIRITNMYGVELTTYDNGLQTTSFGGDKNWLANAMLIKFNNREKFKIEFANDYHGTSYDSSAVVKNALVFGTVTESLPKQSYSFEQLFRTYKWFLYDVKTNYIHCVELTNTYINYFRRQYLDYTNSRHTYNYYDLSKLKYQTDV